MKKHDSTQGRREIEKVIDTIDVFSASSSHEVVNMTITYVQENCIENEHNLTSDIEGLVDLTKEYEELRQLNKHKRGDWDSGSSF